MPNVYDVLVIGLGTMGSQTLLELAKTGARVLGIDRRQPPHDFGSHHGWSRLIRFAYFEHPDYVPLLRQSRDGWTELEDHASRKLFERCGVIQAGPADSELIQGVLRASAEHGLDVGEFPTERLRQIPFKLPTEWTALWEPDAGFLYPEACIDAALNQARNLGAQIQFDCDLQSLDPLPNEIVVSDGRSRWIAQKVVITAGAHAIRWSSWGVAQPKVLRKHLFWFQPSSADWSLASHCPAFLFDTGSELIYGFPAYDKHGVKIARHDGGLVVDPDSLDSNLGREDELGSLQEFITSTTRDLSDSPNHHAICRYSMSPDGHFRLGTSPHDSRIIWASCFSGHGFKFAPSIGLQLAHRVTNNDWMKEIEFLVTD